MMLDFLRQALSVTPVVLALLLIRLANTPKLTRVRQYPMPFVAVVYAIAALVALYALNTWIDDILRGIFQFVPFLRGLYDTTWQYAIENTAILLVFALIKVVLRRVFDRLFQGEDFPGSSLVEDVYRYDPEYGAWFVRPRNGMLRLYLRVFFWASVILTVVIMSLVGMFAAWPGFAAISFPALAALVVGELLYAIDGTTKREFRGDVLGETDSATRITDYAALRDVLKETFPDRVIDDGVDFASSDATQTFGRLDALAHSPDEVDRLVAGYFDRLKQSGKVLDTNLIGASAELMRGRSTLISNPFYGDLTPYLVFPAYFHLLQYRKCLVICGRDAIAQDLVEWMDDGLESITGVPDLWRVDLLTTTPHLDLDVGVLRFADIHNLDLIRANDDFLREVQYVIFAEPSRTLATGQLGLGLVLSRCAGDATPVFAAFDRNHDGLVDALSHLLKVDLTDVVAAALPHGVSSDMVWRADGPPMHSAVLPTITRYLGMGTEIGAVALKYQVSQVEWIGSDVFPVHDMMWIAGQYYSRINAFADLDLSQHALAESFRARSNPWDIVRSPGRFLIVEDEVRNVYESIRLYSTRAEAEGFVNLISEDYLLRDYMVANSRIFAADAKAIPSIVPDFARTERNLVLRLLLTLRTFGMTETALAREFELTGRSMPPIEPPSLDDEDENDRDAPVVAVLRDLVARHTGITDAVLSKTIDSDGPTVDGVEILERRYQVLEGTPVDRVVEALHAAYFFVEDEAEGRDYLGSALYGLVHQTILPGQFVTYAGKYYEVQSIGDDVRRSGVVLRRAAEHIRDRRVYRQLRSFRLRDLQASERTAAQIVVGDIAFTRVFATIEVESLGYLEQSTRPDLARARETLVSGIPWRTHINKELLEIRMPGVDPAVRRTMAVLLNELLVTIFPDAHQYVVALTADPDRTVGHLLDGLVVAEADASDVIYIVEDSPIDMGLIIAVERNWRRLFEIMADYLEWQSTPPVRVEERSADSAVPVFPGDTPEEIEERQRVAAEQDSGASVAPRPPAPPPWWQRLWRWAVGLVSPRGDGEAVPEEGQEEPDAASPVTTSSGEPMASPLEDAATPLVDALRPAEELDEAAPPPDVPSRPPFVVDYASDEVEVEVEVEDGAIDPVTETKEEQHGRE